MNSVVDVAMREGWTELEACMAVIDLMDNRILTTQSNQDTAAAIKDALARYRKDDPF